MGNRTPGPWLALHGCNGGGLCLFLGCSLPHSPTCPVHSMPSLTYPPQTQPTHSDFPTCPVGLPCAQPICSVFHHPAQCHPAQCHPAPLAFTPTRLLWKSTRARRSLLDRLPKNSLTNLLLYLRLSPQPPHCQASRFSRSGASSHVQRSMRPALHALASACVRPAEEMA